MNEDLHAQKLAWFKQNEKPEAVLIVADDPTLMKIVVAWTALDVRPAEKLTDAPDEPDEKGWD